MKHKDIEEYKLEIKTPTGREFIGVVHYTEHLKNHKKKYPNGMRWNPKKAFRNFGLAGIASSLVIGGVAVGINLGPAVYDGVSSYISESIDDIKDEIDSFKSVAFTNYSDKEIRSMPLEEHINLLDDYIKYMLNIPIPAQYQQQGLPEDLNLSKAYADATVSYQDYLLYSASGSQKEQEEEKVLGKYYDAVRIINKLYNGKYTLNMENVPDDYILVNNVKQTNNQSANMSL